MVVVLVELRETIGGQNLFRILAMALCTASVAAFVLAFQGPKDSKDDKSTKPRGRDRSRSPSRQLSASPARKPTKSKSPPGPKRSSRLASKSPTRYTTKGPRQMSKSPSRRSKAE
mmetsp:Transcript_26322/g.57014  ORF Transcript_26322/g.57014 Transcript_26322/m.57014 type:complete len:115 (-) Transcript_26322:64-408(-)